MKRRKMRLLKKIIRYFVVFTLSVSTILTIGYFTPTKWCNSSQKKCDFYICVSDTGIHTNIIVPLNKQIFDWKKYLSSKDIGNYNYLSFGWGDRAFYMSTPTLADLDISTTFNALFLPTPSVMEVQRYSVIPDNLKIRCVSVSQIDYLKLMKFIRNSFQLDSQGKTIRIRQGHSDYSSFYEAKGSYSILRNCNSWTAEGLTKANVNTPLWSGLSSAITIHLRNSCECSSMLGSSGRREYSTIHR